MKLIGWLSPMSRAQCPFFGFYFDHEFVTKIRPLLLCLQNGTNGWFQLCSPTGSRSDLRPSHHSSDAKNVRNSILFSGQNSDSCLQNSLYKAQAQSNSWHQLIASYHSLALWMHCGRIFRPFDSGNRYFDSTSTTDTIHDAAVQVFVTLVSNMEMWMI